VKGKEQKLRKGWSTRPNHKDERNCRDAGIGMVVDVDDMLIREV
jgi:hypothetical protein